MRKLLLLLPTALMVASCTTPKNSDTSALDSQIGESNSASEAASESTSDVTSSSVENSESASESSQESESSDEPVEVVLTFEEYVQNMKDLAPEASYESYVKALALCQAIFDEYDKESYSQIRKHTYKDDVWSEKSESMYEEYWTKHTILMHALKDALQDGEKYAYYDSQMENCAFYRTLNDDMFYWDKDYKEVNGDELVSLGEEITADLEASTISFEELSPKMEQYDHDFCDLLENMRLSSIQADIFADNEELQDLSASYDEKYNSLLNSYKAIFKNAITNDKYKDNVIEYFELTDEDIKFFMEVEVYDDETLALLDIEMALESEFDKAYNLDDKSFDYEQNYLDLVVARNNIAKAFGYDNYYEYSFVENYERDYSVADSKKLTENILGSEDLFAANDGLYEALASNISSVYASYVKESNVYEMISLCSKIDPRASQALLELQTYGNCNFEYRTTKYDGSYVSAMDLDANRFVLVSRQGTIEDYSAITHEFGHYLALTQNDPELEGDNYSLDICEVHSQGMEFLMTNYYYTILKESYSNQAARKLASTLTNYELYQAIWVLMSGSAVATFEEYAYTTEGITKQSLMAKSNELFDKIGASTSYTGVPHVYKYPAYYISYVTSVIPALQLYAMPLEDAKVKYQTIVSYGANNGFTNVLDKVGMDNPFSDEAWNSVITKLKAIAGVQ